MALTSNVIENMTTNYCTMYRCHEIRQELQEIIAEKSGKEYFIYKELTEHFGRIVRDSSQWFQGELGADTCRTSLNEINKKLLIKVLRRKRYMPDGELFVLLFCYR